MAEATDPNRPPGPTEGEVAEQERLATLRRLRALERVGDQQLERIARLATHIGTCAHAAVHLIDDEHQHRLAGVGVPLEPWPRDDSMCRLVVESGERIASPDATADRRFDYTSFTSGDAPVRFYASAPLRTSEGAVVGTLCAFDLVERTVSDEQLDLLDDLAALVVEHLETARFAQSMVAEAHRDELTGLVNRRGLFQALGTLVAAPDEPAAVAFLDLDGFKPINDDLGHDVGDEVLREVATRLASGTRADDLVARFGGDEFVVVSRCDLAAAGEAVERIAVALAEPLDATGRERSVSASVGLTMLAPGDDADSVLRRADALMYAAKRTRARSTDRGALQAAQRS